MNKEELIRAWKDFAGQNDQFMLNPDEKIVDAIAEGVLLNEKKRGLKYCPCRILSRDEQRDYGLICPCNFFGHRTWKDKGECWCSLFIKRK